jgi:hypothetical protein
VESVEGDPTSWPDPVCSELRHPITGDPPYVSGLRWGAALAEVGSHVYVYGTTLVEPYEQATPKDVVLARATEATLADYGQWEFLKEGGAEAEWRAGPPTSPGELSIVADGASQYFTVDRIEIDGVAAWLMVQSSVGAFTDVVVRIAPDAQGGMLWSSLPEASDGRTMIKPIGGPYGIDPPCIGLYGPEFIAYHATGHWDLSDRTARSLMIGYFCLSVDHNAEPGHDVTPWDLDQDRACDPDNPLAYLRPAVASDPLGGRLRFYSQGLETLWPWCTAACETP